MTAQVESDECNKPLNCGAAHFDPLEPNVLKFDLPAGADNFQANGEVELMDKDLFDEMTKNVSTSSDNEDEYAMPRLEQVSIFIDSFRGM